VLISLTLQPQSRTLTNMQIPSARRITIEIPFHALSFARADQLREKCLFWMDWTQALRKGSQRAEKDLRSVDSGLVTQVRIASLCAVLVRLWLKLRCLLSG
jgi:hypothetical protein